jgi:hypothetical protein
VIADDAVRKSAEFESVSVAFPAPPPPGLRCALLFGLPELRVAYAVPS